MDAHLTRVSSRTARTSLRELFGPASQSLIVIGACFVIAAATLHAGDVTAPFFADDFLFLDSVRGRSVFEALNAPDPIGNFYRPLSRQVYFWITVTLFGSSPVPFHMFNVAFYLGAAYLTFLLGRLLSSVRAGAFASGGLVLHYAFDVPTRWASGSQDLLALICSLLCIYAFLTRRTVLTLASLAAAILSKEIALIVPGVLLILAPYRRGGFNLRRDLIPVLIAWSAIVTIWIAHFITQPRDPGVLSFTLLQIPLALLHLGQAALGLELARSSGHEFAKAGIATALVLVGAGVAWQQRGSTATCARPGMALRLALCAVLSAIPIVVVVQVWSAYYYVLPITLLLLAFGVPICRSRLPVVCAALAVIAIGSTHGRHVSVLQEQPRQVRFASNVSRYYILRANHYTKGYLVSLRRLLPTLRPRSVLYFANLPGAIAWQVADGPLVRWAYSDSTLRSYLLSELSSQHETDGELHVLVASADSFRLATGESSMMRELGYRKLIAGEEGAAKKSLETALLWNPKDELAAYMLAWIEFGSGHEERARRLLGMVGLSGGRTHGLDVERVETLILERQYSAADSILGAGLTTAPYAPEVHYLLALSRLSRVPPHRIGAIHAYAARQLAPREAAAWRLWAYAQLAERESLASATSFRRYKSLLPDSLASDPMADRMLIHLRKSKGPS